MVNKGNSLTYSIVLLLVFVLIAIVGVWYFMKNSSQQSSIPQQTNPVNTTQNNIATPTPNLNPNTGDLNTDIKVRMQEVLQ